jgi:hypothetical protein
LNSFVSAGDLKALDIGLVLFGVALACLRVESFRAAKPLTSCVVLMSLVASCVGIGIGVSRHRILGIGPNMFFQYHYEGDRFASGFFQGLRSGERLKQTYAEVDAIVSESKGKRMFFGPRMEWAYAAFRLPSPRGFPPIWDPGTIFPRADEAKAIAAFFEIRNDVLVFLKNDMTYYPPELIEGIKAAYAEDQSASELTVYRLKV